MSAGLATGLLLLAALAYGTATVLQARAVAESPGGAGLLRRLLVQRLYLAGLALDLVGFLGGALAQRALPLFAVQSGLAASIGVTALLARRTLGVRLSRAESGALVVAGAGLLLLAAGAGREGGPVARPDAWGLALLVLAALLALSLPLLSRKPAAAAAVAGLAGGASALCARVLVLPAHWWLLALRPAALALAVSGGACAWAFAVALERGSAAAATATTFGLSTVVPAVVGVAVLGDTVRPGWGVGVVAGVLAVLAASTVLGRFASLERPACQSPAGAAPVLPPFVA